MTFPQPPSTSHKLLVSPHTPLETRPVSSCSLLTTATSFPVDDEDYDVFLDDRESEQASRLRHPAFGLNDGVHLSAISRASAMSRTESRPSKRSRGFATMTGDDR